MVHTFWKVSGLLVATIAGGLWGMKHQYELEEEWTAKFQRRVRLELEKEVEQEQIVEKIMEKEKQKKSTPSE